MLHLRRMELNQYPLWMTQKPTKEDFRGLNQNNFQGVYSPGTPLEACALGARLGNLSASILDPHQLITPHFHRFHSLTTTNTLFSLFSPPTPHFHCFNTTTTTKTTFLSFSPHQHHISWSIVFTSKLPPQTSHFNCFLPPPPPRSHFHCFHPATNTNIVFPLFLQTILRHHTGKFRHDCTNNDWTCTYDVIKWLVKQ